MSIFILRKCFLAGMARRLGVKGTSCSLSVIAECGVEGHMCDDCFGHSVYTHEAYLPSSFLLVLVIPVCQQFKHPHRTLFPFIAVLFLITHHSLLFLLSAHLISSRTSTGPASSTVIRSAGCFYTPSTSNLASWILNATIFTLKSHRPNRFHPFLVAPTWPL